MSDPGVAVVIEDDADVRNLVDAVLTQSGFEVHSAGSGREGVELIGRHKVTIVTLDVGLPDIDGYEVLRRIRQTSNCYVLMLTARTDELDTLTALQSGADDFITKPFRPRELRARIAAMLRRPRAPDGGGVGVPDRPAPDDSEPGVLAHNGLVLNYETRTATLTGNKLSLTRSEFDLLHDLLRSAGSVRTKANLVRVVRGHHYRDDAYISDADERAVEVHMGNLRRKLGEDSREPRWLFTVRGVGYRLAPARD
ncbi:response regulator transcription factor [Arthrobacter sp. H20]|uniref:response regulator transcription factor n=1 Tax=Arthrobacter sp. H20 TaxID=1267981 RepID=UPI00047D76C6|nr:response regulator transcription factor [Arthrobacter sp. H20]